MNKKGNKTQVKPIKDAEIIKAMGAYLKRTDAERGQAAYIVWLLCVNGGLRVSDALALRVANICGNGKRVKLEIMVTEQKTHKQRMIPLGDNVRRELQEYVDGMNWRSGVKYQSYLFPSDRKPGKHYSYQWMNNRIKEAAAVCGIDDNAATHIMRKTFARRWFDINLPRFNGSVTRCAAQLQENVLHHSRLAVTLRYIDAEAEYARETFRGIDITT